MTYEVNKWPLTKFYHELQSLYDVDDDAFSWLETTEITALAKRMNEFAMFDIMATERVMRAFYFLIIFTCKTRLLPHAVAKTLQVSK